MQPHPAQGAGPHTSEPSLAAFQFEASMNFGHLEHESHAHQNALGIPSFDEASFLEPGGSPFPSFSHDFHDLLPVKLEPHQPQGQGSQVADALASGDQEEMPQGQLDHLPLLCPASIEKYLGDVTFPEMEANGSATWDQIQPLPFFAPQIVDEMPPIPDMMPGVDLPFNSPMLPLRDLTVAELPPNVTVTLKGRRAQQQASLGHLSKVMQTVGHLEQPLLRSASEPAVKLETAAAQAAYKPSGPDPQRRTQDDQAAGPSALPPLRRRPSTPLQERPCRQQGAIKQEPLRPAAAAVRPHTVEAYTLAAPTAAAAAAGPAQTHKRRRTEDAPEKQPPPPEPRQLRRRGDIPKRLAAILENERSPSNSEGSDDRGEGLSSQQEASPSKGANSCRLSKAACRAQGAMYQLSEQEVMEVEAELSPDATEEERTAAYKRARNRSAARKTRRRKVDAVQEMQEKVQALGQQNRALISKLNSLIAQVEVSSRENATLKGLLRYLQLQPDAAKITPSLADLEALKNDMIASLNDSAAGAAPVQLPAVLERAARHSQEPAPPARVRVPKGARSGSTRVSDSHAQHVAAAALAAKEGDVSAALSHLVTTALTAKPAQ